MSKYWRKKKALDLLAPATGKNHYKKRTGRISEENSRGEEGPTWGKNGDLPENLANTVREVRSGEGITSFEQPTISEGK